MSPREGWLVWFSKPRPVSNSPSGTHTASPLQREWITWLEKGSRSRKAVQVFGAAASSMRPPRALLADLDVGHLFQRAHHARVVPLRATVRGAGVEEFLRGGGVGQRHAELARGGEREVEVLLVQLDAEARVEGALDHALAVHLEDARVGEAAHQRLAHLGR